MKVEVLKPFGLWSRGKIIADMPSNQAAELIARGLVREILPETRAIDASPVDRMMRAKIKKRA